MEGYVSFVLGLVCGAGILSVIQLIMNLGRVESLVGKVWTGWGGECQSEQFNTPCMYIVPEPMEDGIFPCNILKKFAGKRVELLVREVR